MKKIINKIIKFIESLVGGGGIEKPVSFLRSIMVTPFFVLSDQNSVKKMARQVKQSKNFNSICGLIDLQDGRNYIFRGRNRIDLHQNTERNIKICLEEGVSPLLIIRNDWAVRRNQGFYVPSAEGTVNNSQFYKEPFLRQEKDFLTKLYKKFGNKIDIQLSIEPDNPESARFALELGKHLRSIGFKYKIIANPIGNAVQAHLNIKPELDGARILLARSRNGNDLGHDPIINTDGNMSLNSGNIIPFMSRIKADGREYIIWTQELANSSHQIHENYL